MSELYNVFDTIEENLDTFESGIEDIKNSLNPNKKLRYYQLSAINRLIYYSTKFKNKKNPTHLLFNLSVGSGKTLIMAAHILYLYKLGYRKFIFFVHTTPILKKTHQNFFDNNSSKYLFNKKIFLNNNEVKLNLVNNFANFNDSSINIILTTIQKFHYQLSNPSENEFSMDDFLDDKVVFLSDEAHHINALTKKKLNLKEMENFQSWEKSVFSVHQMNKNNILLEYTATIDDNNPLIKEKYYDKTIHKYNLKKFNLDKFTKNIELIYQSSSKTKRIIEALIINLYKRKVAIKYKINLKPLLIIKSKTKKDSVDNRKKFFSIIKKLTIEDIKQFEDKQNKFIKRYFDLINNDKQLIENDIDFLKRVYSVENTIEVNSDESAEDYGEELLNLENNNINLIFAVRVLDEGWDVLNLFDILRLDDKLSNKETISDEQLIGRGSRYFPFLSDNKNLIYERQFDDDLDNELRVLETLHYYSINESEHIKSLNDKLIESGAINDPNLYKIKTIKIKPQILTNPNWKSLSLFKNKQIPLNKNLNNLKEYLLSEDFKIKIYSNESLSTRVFLEDIQLKNFKTKEVYFDYFENNIINRGIHEINFFRFENLLKYFKNLKSIDEFIFSKNYLGSVKIKLLSEKENFSITNDQKLFFIKDILLKIMNILISKSKSFVGDKVFEPVSVNSFKNKVSISVSDNERMIDINDHSNDNLRINLNKHDWYIHDSNYGTSEEKYFIRFFNDSLKDYLKDKFKNFFLIRNEKYLKVYDFETGKGFEPDFILILIGGIKYDLCQLFVEPKGSDRLLSIDEVWKEKFIEQIYKLSEIDSSILHNNKNVKLGGFKFFNKENEIRDIFVKDFHYKIDMLN